MAIAPTSLIPLAHISKFSTKGICFKAADKVLANLSPILYSLISTLVILLEY